MKRRKYKKGDLEKRLKALDKFEKQSKNSKFRAKKGSNE